jgi:hypothetical protein
MQQLPVTGVIPIAEMRGENDEETDLLRAMSERAQQFLGEFAWCSAIREFYFGDGIGNVFAVFLARIQPSHSGIDEFLWVVVGDIPPAYLVTDACHTPKEAMEGYIEEMRRWVAAAYRGQTSKDIIPVNAAPTPESAKTLEQRLNTLERDIFPVWFVELGGGISHYHNLSGVAGSATISPEGSGTAPHEALKCALHVGHQADRNFELRNLKLKS